MKRAAIIYLGPPGSGKTFLANSECDFVLDDAGPDTEIDIPDTAMSIGITTPLVMAQRELENIIDWVEKFAFLKEIVFFEGDINDCRHNVRGRNDGRACLGLLDLMSRVYLPRSFETQYPKRYITVRRYHENA